MENIKFPNCGREISIEDALCTNRKKRSGSNSKKFSEQAALVNVQKLELEKQSRVLEEKAKEQERNLKRLIESGVREQ